MNKDHACEVYGVKQVREVHFTMAGGGSHWWSYVLTDSDKVYIEDRNGRQIQDGQLVMDRQNAVRLVDQAYATRADELLLDYEEAVNLDE